jgi:hypothetical protein
LTAGGGGRWRQGETRKEDNQGGGRSVAWWEGQKIMHDDRPVVVTAIGDVRNFR